jgi:hypothetical protein
MPSAPGRGGGVRACVYVFGGSLHLWRLGRRRCSTAVVVIEGVLAPGGAVLCPECLCLRLSVHVARP